MTLEQIIQEINQALKSLKEMITPEDNIDEVCAKINAKLPQGETWAIINCYPAADEEDLILALALIEGQDCVLEVRLSALTD